MIPCISYLDLVPRDIAILTRERFSHVDGNVSAFEIDVINRLVKYKNPETLFEIGTFDGRTTLNMAAHSAPHARLFTLDLPPSAIDLTALRIDLGDRTYIDKSVSGARFAGTDVAHKIVQLYGDSAVYDFSPYFGKIDFLFVDGSHSYDYVMQDSQTALKIIKSDGIILWHDYVPQGPTPWPGLTRALNQLYDSDPRFQGLMHIAGTAIVMLQVPRRRAEPTLQQSSTFGDSSQPEYLLASLQVDMAPTKVKSGTPLRIRVRATNTGRTIWLPSDAPKGPVRLGSRLLDAQGTWLNDSYSRCYLPGSNPVAPRETVVFEGQVPCPPIGKYFLEFDFVAEGVAWFTRNGANPVRIQIEVE